MDSEYNYPDFILKHFKISWPNEGGGHNFKQIPLIIWQ